MSFNEAARRLFRNLAHPRHWWIAIPLILVTGSALANYAATQGAGTNFASVVLGGTVHYFANMLCDFTTGQTQCASVNASGQVGINGPVSQSGTWSTRVQDTAGNGITSDTRGTARPLAVEILDASGNQITAFGAAPTNFGGAFPPAGTAIGMTQGGNLTALSGTAGNLNVNCQAGCSASNSVATPPTLPAGATQVGVNVGGSFTALSGTGTSMNVNITNLNPNNQNNNAGSAPVVLSNQQMTAAGSPSTTQVMAVQGTTGGTPLPVSASASSEYPTGSVPLTGTAASSTAASTVTLASSAGHTVFICSLSYRSNATAAVTGNLQVAGLITGTTNYMHWTAPAGNGIGVTEEVFSPCVPASAQSTSIVITSPAPGSGGNSSLTATGYLTVGNGY